jgi:thiol-disulfide isomerase/thioredoxin
MVLFITTVCLAEEISVEPLKVGESAPDFELRGIDGKTYRLKSFGEAEVLVIIFTANHCPTAQAYEDRIIQLVKDYGDKKVAVVCISSNSPEAVRLDEMGYTDLGDSFEDMRIRARDQGFNFPYLYDGDEQNAIKAYGAQTTPHVFIFDKNRKLRYVGRIDDSEKLENVITHDTRDAIEAVLAGREVAVKTTKTFGCSIKWAYKKESAKQALEKWNAEEVRVETINLDGVRELVKNPTESLRLINIWATWCGPCITEFPQLIEINRMYRHREFEMVTVSIDEPGKREQVLRFLEKNFCSATNYHYGSDDKYKFIETLDKEWPGSLPYTMLVEPGGEIVFRKLGAVDGLELKRAIVEYVGRYYE